MRPRRMNTTLALLLSVSGSSSATAVEQDPPRLIVQITAEQLRRDLPSRFMENMGDDG